MRRSSKHKREVSRISPGHGRSRLTAKGLSSPEGVLWYTGLTGRLKAFVRFGPAGTNLGPPVVHRETVDWEGKKSPVAFMKHLKGVVKELEKRASLGQYPAKADLRPKCSKRYAIPISEISDRCSQCECYYCNAPRR